jgi:glycosyltransferase involved in cell wall biosynthesis
VPSNRFDRYKGTDLNIAHLLPYSAHFPLEKHNGRYEWALRLARLQVRDGHTVTIYSAPGSHDEHQGVVWSSIGEATGDKQSNNIALIKSAFNNGKHDIYHSHFDNLHYQLADMVEKPVIYTQHWFPNEKLTATVHLNTRKNVFAVPPTLYMARENERLGIPSMNTIYHGIDLELFKPVPIPAAERLIFVGRITEGKGLAEAVSIALAADHKLDIVGKLNNIDIAYWDKIKQFVDGDQIRYLGPKTLQEVAALLPQAQALLFPSKTIEAFGQVTIEAQASGTPVIISGIGASSELVINGKTGFIANTEEEYLNAISNLGTINRSSCRQFAMKFSIEEMAANYYIAYELLVHG